VRSTGRAGADRGRGRGECAKMRRRLTSWLEAAGVDKHLHPYNPRHTFASLAADGGPITRLADYMGNDPVTLERYYRQPVTPIMRLGIDLAARAEPGLVPRG